MLRHFPFGEAFDAGMGGRVLQADEPLLDLELDSYLAEVREKRRLLEQAPADYFLGGEHTLAAQWEIVELLIKDLTLRHPESFGFSRQGKACHWQNRLLEEELTFDWGDAASLPLEPLDWIGRQVQEDLVLVSADHEGHFVGGQLCFPNGWDIPDRVGKSFLELHVRTAQTTMPSVHAGARLLASLRPGKVFCRLSWNLKLTGQLDLSTKYEHLYRDEFARRAPLVTPETAGREVFIRIERQTFARLQSSPHLLFGIHTYCSPFEAETADPERARRLLAVLRGAPEDVRRYKGIGALEHALMPYLARCAGEALAS